MKKILIALIDFYRKYFSPLKKPYCSCKFIPVCSSYAKEAFEKHGVFKGGLLSLNRFLRCNPFSNGGLDQVP